MLRELTEVGFRADTSGLSVARVVGVACPSVQWALRESVTEKNLCLALPRPRNHCTAVDAGVQA